ncbi:MAG: N(G),N(G)-dimethylarginine dimethylaminohydrolase [Candidatus Korarchaeota archaeon]|nr:N(G),N(G)-dimethylarginine dimethylaminohydrolase [Candidatus Korarchaeota archaeon]NIU82916.1 N(G),N(G)-dimethylarginine dimethylaminohydrolase [Candidatus Thorarchaeota archaeon]NIW14182.1 N(G),N(G)-dimethylarginine dimethylaminohydrolase [Candidatus Thorarchaeota archaeon]NIW52290.1 N(G),N(G)-dimethylarginine dimethylaminohydrolase [Candidatus Korarchaeota archaeon]
MYKHAIVRKPSYRLLHGISTVELGTPDYITALKQHASYIKTLETCDLSVTVLPADDNYPDSTFVEDTAVLMDNGAVITNLGAESRKGEEENIRTALEKYFTRIKKIHPPGTLEGGDVMRAENHFFIGMSHRTNKEGARQLRTILEKDDYQTTIVRVNEMLHLKSGVEYLGDNTIAATGELLEKPAFESFNIIEIDNTYATDFLKVNEYIMLLEGFPRVKRLLEDVGFTTKTVNISEFKKLDAGLSCLSLLF